MDANWPISLKYVRADEGGNDDDKDDPGGRTSRGVTQREYNADCKLNGWAGGDVWKATDDQINTIYQKYYWNPWCPQLPGGLDYLYFDMNVNMGGHEATILLQRGLGVAADGAIGPITLAAAKSCNPITTIDSITRAKSTFYHQLRTWWKYGKGWTARYMRAAQRAALMAKGIAP